VNVDIDQPLGDSPVAPEDSPGPGDSPPESPILSPAARAKGRPIGVDVVLGDGQTWTVARCGLFLDMTAIRDDLYDLMMIKSSAVASNVLGALWFGLAVNYDLSNDEIRGLLGSTDPGAVVAQAWEVAVPIFLGPRTFTAWARSALFANAIRPSEVPEADLPYVLDQLVRTGRAVPHDEYTDAGVAAAKRSGLMNIARQLEPRPSNGDGARLPTE
jgi:hypothetical protein